MFSNYSLIAVFYRLEFTAQMKICSKSITVIVLSIRILINDIWYFEPEHDIKTVKINQSSFSIWDVNDKY